MFLLSQDNITYFQYFLLLEKINLKNNFYKLIFLSWAQVNPPMACTQAMDAYYELKPTQLESCPNYIHIMINSFLPYVSQNSSFSLLICSSLKLTYL